ncbi:hypothetical protein [Pyrolobus fumarii]|uniref:hypothetical protein n=1 Tax=Pyrolobus fumarii TaxID=54252 RepID=UPI001432D687|nr:hypothetical protein [Pyrolobus fumarii]
MYGVWSNPIAYHTGKLLSIVASLPDNEYIENVRVILEGGDAEMISLHWAVFNTLVYNWARFEEDCRGRRRCKISDYLPEGVDPRQASSFFNDETRRVIVQACVDLAPDWVIPSWVKWVAGRYGIDLSVLRGLSWGELLGRLADYSVYVWGLRGLTASYMEFFQMEGMEYALVVVSHVHWEIVEATAEPLEAALEPIRRRFSVTLEEVRKASFEAGLRFAESEGRSRLGLREVSERAVRRLREALVETLEEVREAKKDS